MSTETSRKRRQVFLEAGNLIGLALVAVGTLLIIVGYFVPKDFVIDPDVSARINERRSWAAYSLARKMDVCVVVGTVCIGVGGLWVLGLTMFNHFAQPEVDELQALGRPRDQAGYGSMPGTRRPGGPGQQQQQMQEAAPSW